MSLRNKVKSRIQGLVNRLSGEHSAVAPEPEQVQTYRRPGRPNDEAEVVMARLNRPAGGPKADTPDDGA
jgi:hypothetical protein